MICRKKKHVIFFQHQIQGYSPMSISTQQKQQEQVKFKGLHLLTHDEKHHSEVNGEPFDGILLNQAKECLDLSCDMA